MRVEDYEKYMNVVRDLAYVEYDLRERVRDEESGAFAQQVLYERFGV